MIIPYSALSRESLVEIVKDFLLTEEHLDGSIEFDLEAEIQGVIKMLTQEKLFIVYQEVEDQQPKIVTKAECRLLGLI